MDNFLKTDSGFETTLRLIETINRSTDDYLFIWDIKADTRWFFGDIDEKYDIRKNGSDTNSTTEMMRIIYPADRDAVLKSLTEIAFDNGFNSLNTFCRCFKKHFSCTPSEYKKSKV